MLINNFNGYLYHIVRNTRLQVGQKLSFGGTPNNFSKILNSLSFNINDKDINILMLNKPINQFNIEELKTLKSYVYESCMITREYAFEHVRLKEFSSYPSRLECLYANETLEECEKWLPILLRMNRNNPPLQIVKLKAKGTAFKGDASLILRDTLSMQHKLDLAQKYWTKTSNFVEPEILFVGEVEVEEIIKEL